MPGRVARPSTDTREESSVTKSDAGEVWVKHQLAELRDRTLKWTPRSERLERVTFAGEKLVAVLGSDIVVVDPAGKVDLTRTRVDGPHQLASLADGSVLGVGPKSTFRLRPGAKNLDNLTHVSTLPSSQVYGSASDAARFDIFDVIAGQWMSYSWQDKPSLSSLWLPQFNVETPELKLAHCAQLADGGYGCFANDQLWHFYSRNLPKSSGKCGPGLSVWRVLAAPRADQLWVARNDGRLEKWWLGPPPKQLNSIQLPWTPLDLSAQRDTLAVIKILQERAEPKQMSLVVLDAQGTARFEQPLFRSSEDASTAIDQELSEVEVLVHSRRPWVAVRTHDSLRLIHALTGETIAEVR